jgi:hypothetical protein
MGVELAHSSLHVICLQNTFFFYDASGGIKMSADWFFMKKGFFGKTRAIGPIAETDFMHKIEKGEISPETMVSSTSKTHGHWMHLKEIRVGLQLWKKTHPSSNGAA